MSTEEKLRRQLRWAYGLIVVLVLLLVISLNRGGPQQTPSAEPAGESAQVEFDRCLAGLSAEQAHLVVETCERAVELDPTNLSAQHNLGYAYRVTGNSVGAIEVLKGVLEGDPLNVRTMYELGSAYVDAGQTDEARRTFQELLAIQPDHGWASQQLQELGS